MSNRKIVVLLGGPGCGKGTQAKMLAESRCLPHVSTGDMLRASVAAQSPLGQEVQKILESGGLVSDDIMKGVVAERLAKEDVQGGVLLDGYPRTLRQADDLKQILAGQSDASVIVLNIQVAADVLQKRIGGRRSCPQCGRIYNIYYQPSAKGEKCESCDVATIQRKDDQEDVVRQRLEVYTQLTEPLIAYYRQEKVLRDIDGERDMKEIFQELDSILRDA